MRNYRKWLNIVGVLVIVTVVVTGVWCGTHWQSEQKVKSFFSSNLRQETHFRLYFPTHLPKGYAPTAGSAHLSSNVVSFGISYSGTPAFSVSEQAKNPSFDYDKFYRLSIDRPKLIPSPEGNLATGKLNDYPICSLVTKTTWIIVASPSKNSRPLEDFCQAMRPI